MRVQLVHADALIERGHRVRIVTKGSPLTWRSSQAEWVYVDDFRQYDARDEDFVVGTFWVTVPYAHALAGDRAVHLCQGYEGAFSAYETMRDQIDAAYSLPIPKLVVTKSLVSVCQRFTDDVTYIGQVVEDEFYRPGTPREHDPLRVLLCGQAQADLRGIDEGYGAVAHARWFHQKLDLIRVSPWAPSKRRAARIRAGVPRRADDRGDDAARAFVRRVDRAEPSRRRLRPPRRRGDGVGDPVRADVDPVVPLVRRHARLRALRPRTKRRGAGRAPHRNALRLRPARAPPHARAGGGGAVAGGERGGSVGGVLCGPPASAG